MITVKFIVEPIGYLVALNQSRSFILNASEIMCETKIKDVSVNSL